MPTIAYEAIAFVERLQTEQFIPTESSVTGRDCSSRIEGTVEFQERPMLWEGDTWKLFALTNRYRISASYINSAKEVRGIVQTAQGTGIPRKVIALSQVTHQVLGSTTSDVNGNFTLKLETSAEEEVTVIAIPDALDQRNEVIIHGVIPVDPL